MFISFAQFEATIGNPDAARDVFDRAYVALKEANQREECVMLLEAWEGFEQSQSEGSPDGNAANIAKVEKLKPKKIRKKRRLCWSMAAVVAGKSTLLLLMILLLRVYQCFFRFAFVAKVVDVSITLCNVTVTGTSTTFSPMMKRQRAA